MGGVKDLLKEGFSRANKRGVTAGWVLGGLPQEYLTKAVCEAAFDNDPEAILYMPKDLITKDMRRLAVERDPSILDRLDLDGVDSDEVYALYRMLAENGEGVPASARKHGVIDRELVEIAIRSRLDLVKLGNNAFYDNFAFAMNAMRAIDFLVEKGEVDEKSPWVSWAYGEIVSVSGYRLCLIPREMKTPRICQKAVKDSGMALFHVPEDLRTSSMCLLAVKEDGLALKYVPDEVLSKKLCLAAVESKGSALKHVPEKFRSPEVYRAAVDNTFWVLDMVPEEMRSRDLCLTALKGYGELDFYEQGDYCYHKDICDITPMIPAEVLDYDFCKESFKFYPQILDEIETFSSKFSFNDKTKALLEQEACVEAKRMLMEGGDAGERIAEWLSISPNRKRFTEKIITNEALALQAVNYAGKRNQIGVFEQIPDKVKTRRVCEAAIANMWSGAIKHVPLEHLDLSMYDFALKYSEDGAVLKSMFARSPGLASPGFCEKAVKADPVSLYSVPKSFQVEYPEICYAALQEGYAAHVNITTAVPEELQSEEFLAKAVASDPRTFQYLSEKQKTPKVWEAGIASDPRLALKAPRAVLEKIEEQASEAADVKLESEPRVAMPKMG